MHIRKLRYFAPLLAAFFASPAAIAGDAPASLGKRVQVTGEVVDTWCTISGIMYGFGTAHHQCAVWCAVGGIPVSVRDDQGNYFLVLRIGDDSQNVANPKIVKIQTHKVTVDGDLVERDGVKYLLVDKVADDKGIVNLTQDEYGIVPFGN